MKEGNQLPNSNVVNVLVDRAGLEPATTPLFRRVLYQLSYRSIWCRPHESNVVSSVFHADAGPCLRERRKWCRPEDGPPRLFVGSARRWPHQLERQLLAEPRGLEPLSVDRQSTCDTRRI